MTNQDVESIIFGSFDHLYSLQHYLEGKRANFECARGDFASELRNAFANLNEDLKQKDYNRTQFTMSDGETFEINPKDNKQKEFLKNKRGAYSYPYTQTIDLRLRTNGRFNGFVDVLLMEKLRPLIDAYLKFLEGEYIPVSIDEILNDIFFNLNSTELAVLKKNLAGESSYISLTYTGTKTDLWIKLGQLRVDGRIDRKQIALVFSKYVRWKSNSLLTSQKLEYKQLYTNI